MTDTEAAVGDVDPSAPAVRRGPLDVAPDKQGGPLDLVPHPAGLTEVYPGSTGEGDDAIQAYNYRLCLSRDLETRHRREKPAGYDRTEYLDDLEAIRESGLRVHLLLRYLPNDKADMNSADLPGENHDYPEADAPVRCRHPEHEVVREDAPDAALQRVRFALERGLRAGQHPDRLAADVRTRARHHRRHPREWSLSHGRGEDEAR